MKPKLVIWGASGHARVVADMVLEGAGFDLVGFVDDVEPTPRRESSTGLPVLGGADVLPQLRAQGVDALVVGFGDSAARLRVAGIAEGLGFTSPTVIHPRAIVARSATLGPGTVIAAGAVVNPCARLGRHVIVNTGATIDHDCELGDGVHISPGAHLAGRVVVGRTTWVGIGAVVIQGVVLGEAAIIGAGAVVVRDIPARTVAYGVPAKPVRMQPS